MLRLETPLDFRVRTPGKYLSGEILVPDGQTFFTARIARPNGLLGEQAWPDRGNDGKLETHAFDNDKTESVVGGLDTEVLRAYFFVSIDSGVTWQAAGHVGACGGHVFDLRGDIMLDTIYFGRLPVGTNRLIQVVTDFREGIETNVEIDVDDRVLPQTVRRDDHHSIAVTDVADGYAAGASSVSSSTNLDPTGVDRYLAAFSAHRGNQTYTSITFGAATQTQIATNVMSTYLRMSSAGDIAPSTTGAAVTYTAGGSCNHITIGAVAFSGVDQATPRDASPAAATGTSASAPALALTAGEAGDVRIASMLGTQWNASGITVGSGETSRVVQVLEDGAYDKYFAISTKEDNGSDDMNWTPAPTSEWIMRGFNINMAAGSASVLPVLMREYRARG